MTTLYGSNTTPHPAALKHFFKCQERSGSSMVDSVGGVVFTPSVIAGRDLAFNQNNSFGTVCPTGHGLNDKAIPISNGTFHTFAGSKPIITLFAARYVDAGPVSLAPRPESEGGCRVAIGDINGIGTINNVSYATPAGIGLVSDHVAMGQNSASANTWRMSNFNYGDNTAGAGASLFTPGYVVEPDLTNYPVDTMTSATTRWLEMVNFKFGYEDFHPYRVSPAPVVVQKDLLFIAVHDPVGGTKSFEIYDIDTGTLYLKSHGLVYASLSAPFTPNPCMRVSGLALYGYQIWEFDSTLPTDWLAACQWMAKRWKLSASERVCYPAWNNLT